jgi:uncharacterized protein (DUF427 family)
MTPMSDATTAKPILQPGPDHPITIEPNPARVLVKVGDTVVADTRSALTLREASYPPVQYVPLEDVDSSLLAATDNATYCPYKGDASYYTITVGDDGENAVWEYRDPYSPVAEIKGHVAFYANRVQLTEESAA